MKKVIILLLMMSTLAFSADEVVTFMVETPEMVDMYFLIFSAIGRMFTSNGYVDLLRTTFLIGGFGVFVGGVFKSINMGSSGEGAISGYFKYLVTGVALLTLVFTQSGTPIKIQSRTMASTCDPTASQSNMLILEDTGMPTILAYVFHYTNLVGTTLTDMAESAYSTVGAQTASAAANQGMSNNNGYMGALKGSMHLLSIDPRKITLRSDLNASDGSYIPPFDYGRVYKTLFTDCILVPFSAKGAEGAAQIDKLKSSPDITQYLIDLYDGGGISVGGINSRDYYMNYSGEVYSCGQFYDDIIKPYNVLYKSVLSCSEPIGFGAVSLLTGAGGGGGGGSIMSNFDQVAIQAGLVTQLEDSTSELGIGVSGVGYATGKTRAEFIQSSLASGSYMAKMLPYLQMTIRAILYAFFPFVFVIVMLPGGIKVLGSYLQSLLWIELWTPTAAILDLLLSSYAHTQYTDVYSKSGLTMMSSIDLLSAGSTIAGVAGYLYLSVPALTWLILKGSAHMMQGITSATAAGMATNIKTDAINKDQEKVAMTNEMGSRSGEDLSMAEAQHFQAIQQGTLTGATSGVNKKTGLNTVTDMTVSKQSKDLSEYKNTSETTGLSGEHLGESLGTASSVKQISEANVGKKLTSSDGSLNSMAEATANVGTNEVIGGMQSKTQNESLLTEQTYKDVASAKTATELGKVKAINNLTGADNIGADSITNVSDIAGNTGARKILNDEEKTPDMEQARDRAHKEAVVANRQVDSKFETVNKLDDLGISAKEEGVIAANMIASRKGTQEGDAIRYKNNNLGGLEAGAKSEAILKATSTITDDGDLSQTVREGDGEAITTTTTSGGVEKYDHQARMAIVNSSSEALANKTIVDDLDANKETYANKIEETKLGWAGSEKGLTKEVSSLKAEELKKEEEIKASKGARVKEFSSNIQQGLDASVEGIQLGKNLTLGNAAKLAAIGAVSGGGKMYTNWTEDEVSESPKTEKLGNADILSKDSISDLISVGSKLPTSEDSMTTK